MHGPANVKFGNYHIQLIISLLKNATEKKEGWVSQTKFMLWKPGIENNIRFPHTRPVIYVKISPPPPQKKKIHNVLQTLQILDAILWDP